MKILIVDDDSRRRNDLSEYLVRQKIVVSEDITEAGCADEAKNLLAVSYYDVLILDVVLPKRTGETGSPSYGLSLLGQLNRSAKLKRPEKIVGITAHLEDINAFRAEFETYCLSVIEANSSSGEWKNKLKNFLIYAVQSKVSRAAEEGNLNALTIHGIRTFGAWQDKLKRKVEQKIGNISFHSYKYGYLSTLVFAIPILRQREVSRLVEHLRQIFAVNEGKEFIVFAHSFGTYLIVHALRLLAEEGRQLPVKTIVLCGSVLSRDYDTTFFQTRDIRIVNDCADSDYILWLSEMFVPGTGMAGKCGFYGFQNDRLINRFFTGGHSSYFYKDDFMDTYWLPLFDFSQSVSAVDERKSSALIHEFCEGSVSALGWVKRKIGLFGSYFIKFLFP